MWTYLLGQNRSPSRAGLGSSLGLLPELSMEKALETACQVNGCVAGSPRGTGPSKAQCKTEPEVATCPLGSYPCPPPSQAMGQTHL